MHKNIDLSRIKQLVTEEVSRARCLTETMTDTSADPRARADVVSAASKLLSALKSFEDKASESMKSHVSSHLEAVTDVLDDMTRRPDAYVDHLSSLKRTVTLKPVSNEEEKTL